MSNFYALDMVKCRRQRMEDFVSKTLSLLQLEKDAEDQQNEIFFASQLHSVKNLEAKGICVQKLQVLPKQFLSCKKERKLLMYLN